jgi:3D (Asp-Asp-Asp) domain-containing protein
LTFFVVVSCSRTENKISPTNIKGTWYLNKWTTYHTLTFDDSTVSVDNNVDTIFTLSYVIKDNSLVTVTQYGNKLMVNKIDKLTVDSLVLDGIHDVKEKRKYSRTKRDWDK